MSAAAETVRIEGLSHEGRGVAHRDGKAVFVAGALPGETVRLGHERHHRRYDEADAAEVLAPAAERVAPCCPHFGVCGGCALQHLSPAAQIAAKQDSLLANLKRLAGLEPRTLWPPLTGPAYTYRRRARLGLRYVQKKARVVVGFHEANGRYVTDSRVCPILVPPGDRLPEMLAQLVGGLDARERIPQVEFAAGDVAGALVFRLLGDASAADIARLIAFGREQDLSIWLQTGGLETLRLLHGAPLLGYALPEFGLSLHFLPTDFVQVNAAVNRAMVAAAIARLELGAKDRVLEFYCGIGNFSLALARSAGEVTSVEGDETLVRRARANAVANGIGNVAFHVADLDAPMSDAPWLAEACDAVLLDPPRTGARALVPQLARLAPRRILYVSCHPATLARDGEALAAAGFGLAAAGVADMFPQTAHAEAMALFERE
ncbi:MAG TPA: 23S rRNA (uracil(1939)-C(5))-methyltransferase RlmD [Gammaproteobacteria bacterium]|nr:23S rRNA (uracil(1939)-C(5))-methyltransferase RlmD [Gammaproteobacteria bacterium]